MAAAGELHAMVSLKLIKELPGYWMDVGQPKDYLLGSGLYLSSVHKREPEKLAKGTSFVGNNLVDASAELGENCKIGMEKGFILGPNVVIGPGVIVGHGVRISRSVIMSSVEIKDHSWITNSIIGWRSTLGRWTRVEGVSVLGEVYLLLISGCYSRRRSLFEWSDGVAAQDCVGFCA